MLTEKEVERIAEGKLPEEYEQSMIWLACVVLRLLEERERDEERKRDDYRPLIRNHDL